MTLAPERIPPLRLWTREEYHRAGDLGLFRPDERLELVNGEVRTRMPVNFPHVFAVSQTARVLRTEFEPEYLVLEEKPLVLSDMSEPVPDVTVLRGSLDRMSDLPAAENAVLVVEVSDSTLAFDHGEKAAAYAASGIPDYWVLNLRDRNLRVHRDADTSVEGEVGYRTIIVISEHEQVEPHARPGLKIRVADLLPPITATS